MEGLSIVWELLAVDLYTKKTDSVNTALKVITVIRPKAAF
jgi:hypothetical protein